MPLSKPVPRAFSMELIDGDVRGVKVMDLMVLRGFNNARTIGNRVELSLLVLLSAALSAAPSSPSIDM